VFTKGIFQSGHMSTYTTSGSIAPERAEDAAASKAGLETARERRIDLRWGLNRLHIAAVLWVSRTAKP